MWLPILLLLQQSYSFAGTWQELLLWRLIPWSVVFLCWWRKSNLRWKILLGWSVETTSWADSRKLRKSLVSRDNWYRRQPYNHNGLEGSHYNCNDFKGNHYNHNDLEGNHYNRDDLEGSAYNQENLPHCWLYAGSHVTVSACLWKYGVRFDPQTILDVLQDLAGNRGGSCPEFCRLLSDVNIKHENGNRYRIKAKTLYLDPSDSTVQQQGPTEGLYISFRLPEGDGGLHAVTAQSFTRGVWYCHNWWANKQTYDVQPKYIKYLATINVELFRVDANDNLNPVRTKRNSEMLESSRSPQFHDAANDQITYLFRNLI